MARIMAIDYGTKRVGIAVTDSNQIIATALTTVHSSQAINFIKDYLNKEIVECFVIGDPKKMNNLPSDVAIHVNQFVTKIKQAFPDIKIAREDERFTSKIASRTMIDSGLKKTQRKEKEIVDQISAVLLLQTYLSKLQNR